MDPNKSNNDLDKTMEIPVQEPAADIDIKEEKTMVMSKSDFFTSSVPEPQPQPTAKETAEIPDEDESFEDEKTGPRMWVPVLISCVALIVMCFSLITTYVVPVLYENGFLSGITKIVTPIIGAEQPPKNTNVLLLGVDKDGYRTDTIMVARYDDTAKTVSVIQIPRDTYVGGNGRTDKKINSAYFSGINQLKTEIKMAYGIDVHKYATVDLEGFRKLVDLLGGVEVNVPINMDYDDPEQNLHIHLKKGTQVLNGKQAEGFVRFRKSNSGVDYNRSLSQREFMSAVLKKATSAEGMLKAPEILGIAGKYVTTDLSYGEILAYATTIMELPEESITFMDSPGTAGLRMGGWYFFVDKAEAADIAKQYFGAAQNLSLVEDNIPVVQEYEPETEEAPQPEEETEPEEEAEPEEEEESEQAPEEEATPKPTETDKPAQTDKPEATPKPMGTAKPVESAEPTMVPVPTANPKHTPIPQ